MLGAPKAFCQIDGLLILVRALFGENDMQSEDGGQKMAYIIAEPCIGIKDTACVDACPVDCIHPNQGVTYDCAGSARTGERTLRVSVDAALRAGIFKASGSFDPMGWSVGARRSFPRP